jgi:phosphoglycolate phosphatase-like HAD superfamily hydrolase
MEKRPMLNDGVDRLLVVLRASKQKLGVLTGNISVVAEEKLRLTGIRDYFEEAFYSDGYFDRGDLVRSAVKTCVRKYRLRDNGEVTVIGDTPRDVEAAKQSGVRILAVASGFFSESELTAAGPNAVFRDLNPSRELLRALAVEVA